MRIEITTWNAICLALLTAVVVIWIFRLRRFVKQGEIHALYSASGEGMVGRVDRSDQPILFWLIVFMHGAIFGAIWIFGFITAFELF